MKSHLALFFVSFLYAILFSWAGQIMPNYLSAEAFVWLRIAFAATLFHLIGRALSNEKINWKLHWKEFAICGFFGTSANMYLFFKGLETTYPINGAVLMLFTPLFVAIFDHIRVKKWPKPIFILAVAIAAAASVALMTANGVKFSEKTLRGDIWIAINAIFYAIYLVRVKKLTAHYKPITINRYTFTFGLLFITPFGLGEFIQTNWTAIPLNMLMKIGYILVFTSFLVYLLNAYAIQHSGPTLAGLYIYLQPILASIIAVFLQTDTLTPNKVVYIALVLVSTFAASRFTPKFQSNLDGKSSSK